MLDARCLNVFLYFYAYRFLWPARQVEADLDAVQQQLSKTEEQIAALEILEDKDEESFNKEQQLREEKRQLREGKFQLREKELLLLKAKAADTGTPARGYAACPNC